MLTYGTLGVDIFTHGNLNVDILMHGTLDVDILMCGNLSVTNFQKLTEALKSLLVRSDSQFLRNVWFSFDILADVLVR
jgi:hypothetical protein